MLARFHPSTIDHETLKKGMQCSEQGTIMPFLTNDFMHIGATEASDIIRKMKLCSGSDTELINITRDERSQLHKILMGYKHDCSGEVSSEGLSPIGDYFRSSIRQYVGDATILSKLSTRAAAYMGHPFVVEALITIAANKMKKGLNIYRFANRAPLVLEERSDLITSVAKHHIQWGKYSISLEKIPVGIFVSLVGTKIPFNNILKEYLCNAEVIETTIKEALITCCEDLRPKMVDQEEVSRKLDHLATFHIEGVRNVRKDIDEDALKTIFRSILKQGKVTPQDDEGGADASQAPPADLELEMIKDTWNRVYERQKTEFIRFININTSDDELSPFEEIITGEGLVKNFGSHKQVEEHMIDYFCQVLTHDDTTGVTGFGGTRVLVPPAFTLFLSEGRFGLDGYHGNKVLMFLKWHKAAICEARLICLPFLYAQHWTYLCLNMENQHVYILDSTNKKHCTFEERALRHLEAELVKIWPERPAFTRWPRTFVETQYQEEDDCGIHVMKFLENWNGTGFDEPIDPRKAQDYRLEYLTRMLYHERNLNHHSVDDLLHSTVHGDAGETQTGQGSTDLPGRRTVDQQEEQTTEQPHREEQDQNISKITVLESLDGAGGLQPSQGSNE